MTAVDARPARRLRTLPGLDGLNSSRTNYAAPRGDPGLFGPDSVAWRVHANPVALAVGGIAAVILELAEPRVRSGIIRFSRPTPCSACGARAKRP